MLIMTGSTGEFFSYVPITVTFALAASVFECLFILPLHYLDWGPKKLTAHIDEQSMDFAGEGWAMRWSRRMVSFLLTRALRHRWLTLSAVGLLLVSALAIAGISAGGAVQLIKVKFFPDDYSLYYVNLEAPITWSIEQTNAKVKELSRAVMKDGPGYAMNAAAITGFYISEDYEPVFGSNLGHVAVTLPGKDQRRFADHPTNDPVAHVKYMRNHLAPLAGNGVRIWIRPEKDGPPAGKDINVRAVGPNHESVSSLAYNIRAFLAGKDMLGSVIDIADDRGQPARVFRFQVIPERAAEYGVTPAQVVTLAGTVLNGRYVGKYRLVDEDVDLKVKLDPAAMTTPERALDLPLLEHPSGPVRLGDLARPKLYTDPGQLNRYEGERAITITGNLAPGAALSTAAVVRLVSRHYQKVAERYPGASLSFAGEYESTRKSFQSLLYAFGVALLLIYIILATQFKSYIHPLIILSAVSFALIGVIYGKFLTRTLFTINSFVATVGVAGVVVNDALVLMEFLNKRLRSGLERRQALWQAVHIRLRPILLTTITTTLGLLPMAVGFPEYSLVWGTMASTFVTGLCTATLLTLVVVPVMWDIVEGRREKHRAKREAKLAAQAEAT